jgi:hypothetical protein
LKWNVQGSAPVNVVETAAVRASASKRVFALAAWRVKMRPEESTMTIELTPQQLQVLDGGEPGIPRIVDPRNNASYVLVSETEYETVRDVLEDERRQRGIRRVALRNAIGRMDDMP